jgi:transposase InsO family protein
MTKNALIVLPVIEHNKPVTVVAREFNVSRAWVYELLRRHRLLGPAAFEPESKAHHSDPNALDDETHENIATLRHTLTTEGLDAGAASIQFHLRKRFGDAPSLSSIWRSLRKQGLVEYTPKKKPKLYLQRFEAARPNETWQHDFTHVRLANNADILVLNFLDDHSRLLLSCTAHHRITSPTVVEAFSRAAETHGFPQSSLTDNGLVFTSRFQRGRNAYEILLARLGIEQKNSRPNHPQTQGKIERFHQTLKKWLAARPKAHTLAELQALLDQFRIVYNNERPHRALEGRTPQDAYTSRPKATPSLETDFEVFRPLTSKVDPSGSVTIRHAGRMRHIGVGRPHRGKPVWMIMSSKLVIVTDKRTGEILSENKVEPARSYWKALPKEDHTLDP